VVINLKRKVEAAGTEFMREISNWRFEISENSKP
jgi:hypothetical protein